MHVASSTHACVAQARELVRETVGGGDFQTRAHETFRYGEHTLLFQNCLTQLCSTFGCRTVQDSMVAMRDVFEPFVADEDESFEKYIHDMREDGEYRCRRHLSCGLICRKAFSHRRYNSCIALKDSGAYDTAYNV